MNLFNKEKFLIDVPVKNRDALTLAIAFPNSYSIGMASLGYQTAWKYLNQSKNINTIRYFTDIQEKNSDNPSYIGFSFSWELDYKNILEMLEKNQIPIYSDERKDFDPLIFAGGVVPSANPEPFAAFLDFFLIGDLETIYEDFLDVLYEIKDLRRKEKLFRLSELPFIYIPSMSNKLIKKEVSKDLLSYSSILTENSIWPNTFIVEVVRSCPELCRFCLASYGSLPFRTPDLKEKLIPVIELGLKHTNKIGLLGPSITQHPEFESLINYLLSKKGTSELQVQIASVRADTISQNLAGGLYKLGAKSVTIVNSIQTIYNAGISSIKLYGMVGLPYETEDDLLETVRFLKHIKTTNKGKGLTWGCSIFVPKASTPFQWYGVDKESDKKLKFLSRELHKTGIAFKPESYKWALIQALLSRGDRTLAKCLEKAYRYGFTLGSFNKVFKEENVDIDHYVFKTWDKNTKLPWENIQGHLNKETVLKHKIEVERLACV
ncbi:MAG: radical SAM protein [Candidatus Melainabacteria bacterium]|nr:radical SAM protein [Candidatus Melainabacteria bacterium]